MFASGGPDHHASRSITDAVHRLCRVPEKVQDDLLKLHTIARNGREVVGQLRPNVYLASLKLARRERNDLPRGLVQVQGLQRQQLLAEESAQTCDHISSTVAVAKRATRRFPCTRQIRGVGVQHSKAAAGIRYDARQRLVDLMRGGRS